MILLALTALALGRVVRKPFVSYDDPDYVVLNPLVRAGLTLAGIGAAASAVCVGDWHPLTTLSHMLDVRLSFLRPVNGGDGAPAAGAGEAARVAGLRLTFDRLPCSASPLRSSRCGR